MIYDMVHENNLKLNKHGLGMMLNIKIMSKHVLELVIGGFRLRTSPGKIWAEPIIVCTA